MTDGLEENGVSAQPAGQYTASAAGPSSAGSHEPESPDPASILPHKQPGKKARRRVVVGLNPGGIFLPLAIVCLAVYLLATGWFNTSTPSEMAEPATGTPEEATATRSSPTATPASHERVAAVNLTGSPEPAGQDEDLAKRLAEASLLVQRSRFEEAIEIYAALAREAPEDARPQAGWAWALLLDAHAEQALPHAHQAMVLDPVNAEMAAVLSRVYLELGDKTRALGMALSAVENGSAFARAHTALAGAYLLQQDREQALQEASAAARLDADDPEAHRALAQVYAATGDEAQAIIHLRQVAELLPKLWLPHHELGQALLRSGEVGEAIASFKRALALRPKAATLAGIGEGYYRLGQDQEAQTYLEKSLAAGGRETDSYALLAAVNARLGHCDQARTFYQTVLAQNADNPLAASARRQCEPSPSPAARVQELTPAPEETPSSALPQLTGRIAFPAWNQRDERYDVYVADLASGQVSLVLEGMHQPAFSPDGRWLAGNGERPQQMNLILVPSDGSEVHEITEYIEDALPAWSADGQSLAFSSNRSGDRLSRVYVIDDIWPATAKKEGRALRSDLYEVLGSYPTWTADGQVIYAGCDFRASPIRCGLYALTADADAEEPRQLTDHPDDSAPDIRDGRLAFMSRRDGNWEIYVAAAADGHLQRLTNHQANDGLPIWSPDGQAIAFVSDRGGVWAVWVMGPDGSNAHKLFDIGGGGLLLDWQNERISWAP